MDISQDYYAILGVAPSADMEEIKKAYRHLVRQYHPDAQKVPGTTLLFRQVQEAYDLLSDPALRGAYDRGRAEAGLSPDAPIRWNFLANRQNLAVIQEEQMIYVLIDIAAAKQLNSQDRLPLNLCLVLDRSTSMQGQRLDQVKAATYRLIDSLAPQDALGIVTFSDRAEAVWPSQPVGDTIRIKSRVAAIQAGGGTEIFQGMMAGLNEIERKRGPQSVSHLLLLTDGQTYGDEERCLAQAVEAKKRSISISCLGLGDDWNDTLLDAIANRSGGISAYIASAAEVQNLFQERVRGLGALYADDVQLAIRCLEGCRLNSAFKLVPYLLQVNSEGDWLPLGQLQADSPMSLIAEFIVGPQQAGLHRLVSFELKASIPALNRAGETLRHEVQLHFSPDPPDEPVPPMLLSALAKIAIFKMQDNAWKAMEKGNVSEATRRLEMMATRLLDLGEHHLARAALLEAGRLARSGHLSPAGRKTIKYGTRSLSLSSKERGND